MIGGIIPLVLAVILCMKLPESVQYLVKINQYDRARVILSQIEGKRLNPTAKLSLDESQCETTENPVKALWAGYRWNSIFLWVCCFTSLLVFYLLTSWMPTILKTAGLTTQQFSLIAAIFPFGGVVGAIIMGWYMDKVKPTKVIKYSYLIAVLFFIIAGLVHTHVFFQWNNLWHNTPLIFLLNFYLINIDISAFSKTRFNFCILTKFIFV